MRTLLISILLCSAVISGGAAEARGRRPAKMLHLGTIVVPRRHPERAALAKWIAEKALGTAVTVALSL